MTSFIAVMADPPILRDRAAALARELALPLVESTDLSFAYLLVITPQRLELRQQGPNAAGPVYVDFIGGALAYRRRFGGGRRQLLAKAVGLKGRNNLRILDATAGLGRDAFVLANLGYTVQMVERSPIIAALLRQGLDQAAMDLELGPLIAGRLNLVVTDGCDFMSQLSEQDRPEVVYLDPMYPHRTKTALVKKEMQALQRIVGTDHDTPRLLACALNCARHRVVVKRPRRALAIAGPKPNMAIEGKTTRFDIYLTD